MNWHDYFTYDEETGNLIWKVRPIEHFKSASAHGRWNKVCSGQVAGSKKLFHGRGVPKSIDVFCAGVRDSAHRIIWEMFNGPIPDGMLVDHKDGNPWNNHRVNLRLATHRQNLQNRKVSRNSASGVKGVWWNARKKRWQAYITTGSKSGRKTIYLGMFVNKSDAALRYNEEAIKMHGEFASLNPVTL